MAFVELLDVEAVSVMGRAVLVNWPVAMVLSRGVAPALPASTNELVPSSIANATATTEIIVRRLGRLQPLMVDVVAMAPHDPRRPRYHETGREPPDIR